MANEYYCYSIVFVGLKTSASAKMEADQSRAQTNEGFLQQQQE